MIVRIQGEGQWELAGGQIEALDRIDDQLVEVTEQQDDARFDLLLEQLLGYVRAHGRSLTPEEIVESDLILPPADATLDEVQSVFAAEGVVPG